MTVWTILLFVTAFSAFPETARVYQGKLKPELVVNPQGGQVEPVQPAGPAHLSRLSTPPPAGAKVFHGETFMPVGPPVRFFLVEPASGAAFLIADVNRDGRWDAEERFEFQRLSGDGYATSHVLLHVPTPGVAHPTYPIRLSLPRPDKQMLPGKHLLRSPFVYVEGHADIAGQTTLVWFMYDLKKDGAFADWGWQGVDVNGDGRISSGANSPEYTFARDEGIVYRVNGRDVSPSSLNLKDGTFLLREHPAGDNSRIGLQPGTTVPDFQFVDFEGRTRRLSEFRGKYLLIDFWGAWCAPCRRELPELQSAWNRFRSKAFDILGLPTDEDPAHTRSALIEASVTFTQASPQSVRDLIQKRFRINAYPTLLLLDPAGSIVIADGQQLRGAPLLKTLERILR